MAMTKRALKARAKKAWATRKANENDKAKIATFGQFSKDELNRLEGKCFVGAFPPINKIKTADANISSLCGHLEDAIANLEIRISNLTTRINSIL